MSHVPTNHADTLIRVNVVDYLYSRIKSWIAIISALMIIRLLKPLSLTPEEITK